MVYGNGNSLIWYICIRGSGDEDPDRMDDLLRNIVVNDECI